MLRTAWVAFLFVSALVARAESPPAKAVALAGHQFTLPEGFTIERVAGPPLVDRPIVADFDEAGRLYVADSSGSNDKVAEQLANPTHRIVRLEDTDGDGRFDKSVVFADKMMFPEGTMWYAGSLYVAAPPHIWKLTDTERRRRGRPPRGLVRRQDAHRLCQRSARPVPRPRRLDLLVQRGVRRAGTTRCPAGRKFRTRAAHIFRARPDGSGIEPVMTGGMDNPVDVVFTPGGERIFTTTFLQQPAGGKRDGLIHAVYGGVYGKDHDVDLRPGHRWTSPGVDAGADAPGPGRPVRLAPLESAQFGHEYQRQPLRLPVQPAQGQPACAEAQRRDVRRRRTTTSSSATTPTSIRPT